VTGPAWGDRPGALSPARFPVMPPTACPDPPRQCRAPVRDHRAALGILHGGLASARRYDATCPRDDFSHPACVRLALLERHALKRPVAFHHVALAARTVHVTISSGQHDGALLDAGIGGPAAMPKRLFLRRALAELSAKLRQMPAAATRRLGDMLPTRAWLKSAAGIAGTAVGSIARSTPGGEVLLEAIEGIKTGLDTVEAIDISLQDLAPQ
jgi:hypothetical protein